MLNFVEWLRQLNETPISDFQLMGQWGEKDPKYGWDKKSISILTNQKSVEKIKRIWSKSNHQFKLIFLRNKKAPEYIEYGKVPEEWIKENLGIDVKQDPEVITIIFTQNLGVEKVPMTAWIIAHRFGHALAVAQYQRNQMWNTTRMSNCSFLYNEFFNQVLKDLEELTWNAYRTKDKTAVKKVAQAIGTMRSAREGKLFRIQEFPHELFAQYIITGKVKFNDLPKQLYQAKMYGRPYYRYKLAADPEDMRYELDYLEDLYNNMIKDILDCCEGNIYVM